uniref:DUF1822 domain-containing protein n=1 Tax=Cyanothece sp. (strain PCC 7425 / ATCC 29141) TaxID=395961 RepID=B8HUE6_CYAP4
MTSFLTSRMITIPISASDRSLAEEFSQQQFTQARARQVYLNTLAVLCLHHYLDMLGIPNQLDRSESWDPVDRLLADVGDLYLPDRGRIECRPIRTGESVCQIPPEVWEERLAYMVVEIDRPCRAGTVLGFVPQVSQSQLAIGELRPLEAFLDYLDQVNPQQVLQPVAQKPINTIWVEQIGHRVANLLGAGWQELEILLNPTQLAFRSRGQQKSESLPPESLSLCRGKVLDLGLSLAGQSVALVVELIPQTDQFTRILLQVHPLETYYLPPGLALLVLDQNGTVLRQIQSRISDNYIQLELLAEMQEQFSVRVVFGTAAVTERFVVQENN